MLMEMIGAEWARRRAQLGVTTAVYVSLPLLPTLAVLDPRSELIELAQRGHGGLAMGLLVAAAVWGSGMWTPERKGRWVYFLSLPVGRVRLFALRYLAGLFWLALPVAALAVAARGAAAAAAPHLPPGFYAYPGPLSAWAALASWLLYTAGFVMAARWEHPERFLLVPIALLLLCAILITAGVPAVVAPALEEMLMGDFTPLAILSAPSLIGY